MSSAHEMVPGEPGRPKLGTPKSVSIQPAKSMVGIVCSRREAATEVLAATQFLRSLSIQTSIFVMPQTGLGNFQQWARDLRRNGGIAIWVLIHSDLEVIHKVAAISIDLPILCQTVGPRADEL